MKYAILQHPGHNRVYYANADKLALAETKIACKRLTTITHEVRIVVIEGIRYLLVESENALTETDMQLLSRLSFVFALYKYKEINQEVSLLPITRYPYEYLDQKIGTLLKYQGKTNELFTKLIVNIALLSSDFDYSNKIQLLDPVAGKGTTLFESTVYGFDTFGIETEPKFVHETKVFFKKYLEKERIKHHFTSRRISGNKKSNEVVVQEFAYATSKEEYKSPEKVKKLGVICGNCQNTANYFKNEMFHLIVGDLPYGIVHGNRGNKKRGSITRNPVELLNHSLPAWKQVLKRTGTVAVAWNSHIASREVLKDTFETHGFKVLSHPPYTEFEHQVDRSIKRDLMVAKKE